MTTTAEIATVLETTEANVITRAKGLRILPVCPRCLGSGRYSFNGSHSICYGCGGAGQRAPKASELDTLLIDAIATKNNGRFADYMQFLEAKKITKNAQNAVMNAWTATGVSEAYDWRNASKPGRDQDISAINKKMFEAYETVNTASNIVRTLSGVEYQNAVIKLADTLTATLATIEAARLELIDYLRG